MQRVNCSVNLYFLCKHKKHEFREQSGGNKREKGRKRTEGGGEMVAQSEYRLNRALHRRKKRVMTLAAAVSGDASPAVKMGLYVRYKKAKKDVAHILLRTRTIKTNMSNLNSYSD